MKLLLTRQKDNKSKLSKLLQNSGHQIIYYPCIEIKSLKNIKQDIEIDLVNHNITDFIWTSQVAIEIFMDQLSIEQQKKNTFMQTLEYRPKNK